MPAPLLIPLGITAVSILLAVAALICKRIDDKLSADRRIKRRLGL